MSIGNKKVLLGSINATLRLSVPQRFEAHLESEENPHNVTAEQVGAYTKTQTDNKFSECVKASQIYVDADNFLCIDTVGAND